MKPIKERAYNESLSRLKGSGTLSKKLASTKTWG
jgi:hypothetical protein